MKRNLNELIKKKGFNTKRFAESIGLTLSTLYNVCSGRRDIDGLSHRNYKAIANGLGMDSDQLDAWLNGNDLAD